MPATLLFFPETHAGVDQMPNFGLSAFLKIVCLSPVARRSEIRRRIVGGGGAYDYHRNLRLRAKRLVVNNEPIGDILESTSTIVKAAERQSTVSGLETLERWRHSGGSHSDAPHPVTFHSPSGIFQVTFAPDFAIQLDGEVTGVHLWNTMKPRLQPHLVHGVLSVFFEPVEELENPPDDLAVLSLRDLELFRLSHSRDHRELGIDIIARVEEAFRDVRRELGIPAGDQPGASARM